MHGFDVPHAIPNHDEPGEVLRGGLRLLSLALVVYAAGAAVAAVSASLAYAETTLPFRDPMGSTARDVWLTLLYVAIALDGGSLLILVTASSDLGRARSATNTPHRALLGTYRLLLFVGCGLALLALPVVAVGAERCLDCGYSPRPDVLALGLGALGIGASLVILAILGPATRQRAGRERAVPIVGGLLGLIAVAGDVWSAYVFIWGYGSSEFGWIAFGGFPFLNWNPLWGSLAAAGSGMMARSLSRIARLGLAESARRETAPPRHA